MDDVSILLGLIGIVATILLGLFPVWLDRQKSPKLSMEVGEPEKLKEDNPYKHPPCTWLHVRVKNLSLGGLASKLINREPALDCHAWVTFYQRHDLSCPFDHAMKARWSDTAVPVIDDFYKKIETLPKGLQETVDIQPGKCERLDIAIRTKGDEQCYGWNNEGYLYDDNKYTNPKWQLQKVLYIATVRVETGGRKFEDIFMVCNEGEYDFFELKSIGREGEKENQEIASQVFH